MEENLKFDADEIFYDDPAAQAALENYGIKYLFPWQRLVIANILDAAKGEDREVLGKQIVLLPTGAGKSLCFQIPAILLDGPTLVIYPLLALMSDQYRRMKEGGMECVIFRGGQDEKERQENFRQLEKGAKIIIANRRAPIPSRVFLLMLISELFPFSIYILLFVILCYPNIF